MKLTVALFAAVAFGLPHAQQTPPVFRGSVDLVTVDVSVVDKSGKPVSTLTPADFVVVAGKRPRRVVSADYIAAKGRPAAATEAAAPVIPAPTSNTTPPVGRSFLFVVDVDHVGAGEGRVVVKAIADYLDRLSPDDRVGIVSAPYGKPRVDLTTNRHLVRNATGLIVGAAPRRPAIEMTVGEAAAIERLDEQIVNQYRERLGLEPCARCALSYQPAAIRIMDDERRRTVQLFDTLRALAAAMAPIEGPKTIVLVSSGVINDMQTLRDTERFADAAAKARVTLHALNLPVSDNDVNVKSNMIGPRRLDHIELLDGMSTLAIAGRGDTFLVSGTPTAALARIDSEMSGYYLISFERDPGDRDGERTRIDVKVTRPDVLVRARTEFTPEKPAAVAAATVPKDLKAAIGDALRWPVPLTGLAVDLDSYTLPATAGTGMRTILAATLRIGERAIVATGYEVTDEAGKVVADDVTLQKVSTVRLQGERRLYTAAVSLPPGQYRVKLAAIDETGRRGSVEHGFEVRPARAGALELGELFIGEVVPTTGFVPSPTLAAGSTSLPVRIDVGGDSSAAFDGVMLSLELARGRTTTFATIPLTLMPGADPLRRVATALLSISSLEPGEYVATVRLRTSSGADATTSRLFVKR